jgi:hypothetical protein
MPRHGQSKKGALADRMEGYQWARMIGTPAGFDDKSRLCGERRVRDNAVLHKFRYPYNGTFSAVSRKAICYKQPRKTSPGGICEQVRYHRC